MFALENYKKLALFFSVLKTETSVKLKPNFDIGDEFSAMWFAYSQWAVASQEVYTLNIYTWNPCKQA
ncbi:hypothetical protein [Vibrio sp. YYF0003]|uniref:hypothetical protein n=1 Tax=Vibrio sp. YYF0003 TaxID=3116646 RepID=UPI002EA0C3B2|nr:hypothetical protein [Vibrio sp. YYF0003]